MNNNDNTEDIFEFDLLASHDLAQSAKNKTKLENKITKLMDILVWKKLDVIDYQPSSREGHSLVSHNHSIYAFGGLESSQRTNTLMNYDLLTSKWTLIDNYSDDSFPVPRTQHAACIYDDIMIIHGGETVKSHAMLVQLEKEKTKSHLGDEVCIDDPIGQVYKPDGKKNDINSELCCLDDMYAFHVTHQKWKKLPCLLSPLPRKGHTITLISINKKSYFLLFGGYSRQNETFSNSVHICDVEDINNCYHNIESIQKNPSTLQEHNSPFISWKVFKCSGKAPPGRYLHSATVVTGKDNENFLVVFGGLGKGHVPLSDIYFLNLETSTWVEPLYGCNGIQNGTSGDGPPASGVFAHIGFATTSPKDSATNLADLNAVNNADLSNNISEKLTQLIIYSGSISNNPSSAGCIHNMFCFDMILQKWSKVEIGHLFPSQRHSAAAAMIQGIGLKYHAKGNSELVQSHDCRSLVLFGGHSAVSSLNDTWILSLNWLSNDINRFTGNVSQRFEETYEILYTETVPSKSLFLRTKVGEVYERPQTIKNSIMDSYRINSNVEQSKDTMEDQGLFGSTQIPLSSSTNEFKSQQFDATITNEILTLRRNRAITTVELNREKQRIIELEQLFREQENKIVTLTNSISDLELKHERECSELRKALENSVQKEIKLRQLNEEAYELLTLQGLNLITQNTTSSSH